MTSTRTTSPARRRRLGLLALAIPLVALLAACGGGDDSDDVGLTLTEFDAFSCAPGDIADAIDEGRDRLLAMGFDVGTSDTRRYDPHGPAMKELDRQANTFLARLEGECGQAAYAAGFTAYHAAH